MDSDVLHETVINIKESVSHEEDSVIYFALSGPLVNQFELFGNMSSLKYTKTYFFPHISLESLNYYVTSIIDLIYHKKKPYLKGLHDIFSLVLFKMID